MNDRLKNLLKRCRGRSDEEIADLDLVYNFDASLKEIEAGTYENDEQELKAWFAPPQPPAKMMEEP